MTDAKPQKREVTLAQLIFGIVVWLVASVIAAYTANLYIGYAHESGTWQRTQGVVYESRLRGCDRKDNCNIVVKYRYDVGERTYESKNVSPFETRTYGPAKAKEKLSQYAVGSQVTVFYVPTTQRRRAWKGRAR